MGRGAMESTGELELSNVSTTTLKFACTLANAQS